MNYSPVFFGQGIALGYVGMIHFMMFYCGRIHFCEKYLVSGVNPSENYARVKLGIIFSR